MLSAAYITVAFWLLYIKFLHVSTLRNVIIMRAFLFTVLFARIANISIDDHELYFF